MHGASFKRLRLVPADVVLNDNKSVPKAGGVYFIFFNGGFDLLHAISYFEYTNERPLALGRDVHLYTGASSYLRRRAEQHLIGPGLQSGLRMTLMAIELARGAISKTETPASQFVDEQGLNEWMVSNVHFAFIACDDIWGCERQVLHSLASPFNLHSINPNIFCRQVHSWRRELISQTQMGIRLR